MNLKEFLYILQNASPVVYMEMADLKNELTMSPIFSLIKEKAVGLNIFYYSFKLPTRPERPVYAYRNAHRCTQAWREVPGVGGGVSSRWGHPC